MAKSLILDRGLNFFVGLCVLSLAVASAYFSLYSSFRLPHELSQLAWQLNFDRTAIVFSAGFALTMSLASNHVENTIEKHLSAYAFVILSVCGFVLALALAWPLFSGVFFALLLGLSGCYFVAKFERTLSTSKLMLGISLYILFFLSVLAYLGALVFADGSAGVVLWLLSDVSRVGVNGYLALCVLALISTWLLLSGKREFPSLLLLGLSIGLLGPIMFIGLLVPRIVKPLPFGERGYLLVSGIVGGAALILVSASNSLILGGYAPALIVPLGLMGIPAVLWISRSPKQGEPASMIEALLIMLCFAVSVVVVWHLASFAARLA